jgi:pimeloyl-ACP methyl ester carboxylesterase
MMRGFIPSPSDEDAVVRTSFPPRLVLLSSLALAVGCATTRQTPVSCGSLAPNADVVYVADGSGDYRTTSAALSQAVRDTSAPLRVETFVWSHGYNRLLADHLDHSHHIQEGQRLAALIAASRQTCPDRAIYLVGHSSGSAVVLAAAEASPPGSIERILLLAPAVSKDYDLRPALRASRQGIDVFTSRRDVGALAIGTGIIGTADHRWSAAAGRVGFAPVATCLGDDALYAKLRNHPWDPCVAWTGNRGSHYGTIQPAYARTYLLPLLSHSPR